MKTNKRIVAGSRDIAGDGITSAHRHRHFIGDGTSIGTLSPLIALALTSCGGGGGGGVSATFRGVSGNLVNGPIANADIWLDTNRSGSIEPDADFLVGTTGENGEYSNANPPEDWHLFPLLADLTGATDRGERPNDDSDDVPVSGVWRAPAGSVVISPITNLLRADQLQSPRPTNHPAVLLEQVILTELQENPINFNHLDPNADPTVRERYQDLIRFIRAMNPDAAALQAEIDRMDTAPTGIALSAPGATRPEGTTSALPLATITFTDDGLGVNTPRLVANDPDNVLFDIRGNSKDGWQLWLAAGQALDRESGGETRTVALTADTNPGLRRTFTLRVDDVDESPPSFQQDAYTFAVTETGGDVVVGRVVATDPDATSDISYSFGAGSVRHHGDGTSISGTSLGFTIDPDGTIRRSSLDREQTERYELTVLATSNGEVASATVTVVVVDANDNAPEFLGTDALPTDSYDFTVPEDHRGPVGYVFARDLDRTIANNLLTYSIDGEDSGFWIDARGLVYRAGFDREESARYELTVRASNMGMSSTARVTVVVEDVPEAPAFDRAQYVFSAMYGDTGTLGTAVADDPDDGDDRITYAVAGDAPGGYAIDRRTGGVTWTSPGPAVPLVEFFTVVAASNGMSANADVWVSWTEYGAQRFMEGMEGTYQVPGSAFTNNPTAYSISGVSKVASHPAVTTVPDWLSINATTGEVGVSAATDDGGVGTWRVTVEASGGVPGDAQRTSFDVVIANVNDAPTLAAAASPVAVGQGDQYPLEPGDLRATDTDNGEADLTVTLVSATGDGRLELDYRSPGAFPEFKPLGVGGTFAQSQLTQGLVRFVAGRENSTLTFEASDPGGGTSGRQTLSFDVTPDGPQATTTPLGTAATAAIHELHPLTKPVHRFAVPEGTDVRLDGDAGDGRLFRIDNAGRVWVREVLDFENPYDRDSDNVYRVEALHSAGGGAESRTALDITVMDIAIEEVGTSLETRQTTGVDAYSFDRHEIPLGQRPGEQASYILEGLAYAMPVAGPLVLTWSFSPTTFRDLFGIGGAVLNALDTAEEYEYLRWVMERCFELYEQAANLKFIEVANTHSASDPGAVRGDLTIGFTPIDRDDDGYSETWGGVAFLPTTSHFENFINIGYYPARDNPYDLMDITRIRHLLGDGGVEANIGWQVIIHEVGHALGLKHPWETRNGFPANGREAVDRSPYAENTVMDYNNLPTRPGYPAGPDLLQQPGVSAPALGQADIDALQFLYGAPGGDWNDGVERFFGFPRASREIAPGLDGYEITNFVAVDEGIDGGADGTVVFEVEPADPGLGRALVADSTSYSLPAGVLDNDQFTIDAATGEARFRVSPDFEAPRDGSASDPKYGRDNGYAVIVAEIRTLTDTTSGARSADTRHHGYLVAVGDVAAESSPPANRSPWAGSTVGGLFIDQGGERVLIRGPVFTEGVEGTFRIPDSAFQDPEDDDTLNYRLEGALKGWATVSDIPDWLSVSADGTVSVAATTDNSDVGTYTVTVSAGDGHPGNARAQTVFSLVVEDSNLEAPVLTAANFPVAVPWRGEAVLAGRNPANDRLPQLLATDADPSDGPDQLVYHPTLPTSGGNLVVLLGGTWNELIPGGRTTFTQRQVDDGEVRFAAWGEVGTVTIEMVVVDSASNRSMPVDLVFEVQANTPPEAFVNLGILTFNEGRAGSVRIPHHAFTDAEEDDVLVYSLVRVEREGADVTSSTPWLTVRTEGGQGRRTTGFIEVSGATGDGDVGIYDVTIDASDNVQGHPPAEMEFQLVIADFI